MRPKKPIGDFRDKALMNDSKHPSPGRCSVCMIVKNEADLLERCLQSVAGCADEIIVVDTGSTDGTVAVAQGFGAAVVQSDWRDDFSYSRNISIGRASNEWILWLDADDVVPPPSIPKINSLKRSAADRVYGFVVINEKPGNTGTEFMQARMFPNRRDVFFEGRIHEQMMPSALRLGLKFDATDIVVEHHGYADPQKVQQKAGRNIKLLLDQWNTAKPDPVAAIEIADAYAMLGKFTEAETWYKTVLAVPGCEAVLPDIAGQACLGIGNILNKEEKYGEAGRFLQKALLLSPHRPDALFSLAVAQDLGGDLEGAVKTLMQIHNVQIGPLVVGIDFREARIKAYLRLERVLGDLKKNSEALAVAKQAAQALPQRPEILDMAGRVFLKNNMLMDALHSFEKSLELNTESNLEGYIGLCRVYLIAGRKENAIKTLTDIRPLFEEKSMYWAFWRMITGPAGDADVPEFVDKKEVDAETSLITRLYFAQ
jgi:tetratricopeptide (TPR) repeat protein